MFYGYSFSWERRKGPVDGCGDDCRNNANILNATELYT